MFGRHKGGGRSATEPAEAAAAVDPDIARAFLEFAETDEDGKEFSPHEDTRRLHTMVYAAHILLDQLKDKSTDVRDIAMQHLPKSAAGKAARVPRLWWRAIDSAARNSIKVKKEGLEPRAILRALLDRNDELVEHDERGVSMLQSTRDRLAKEQELSAGSGSGLSGETASQNGDLSLHDTEPAQPPAK